MNITVKFNTEDEKNYIIDYNKNILKKKIGNTKLDKEISNKYDCFYMTDNEVLVMGMSSVQDCVSFEKFKRLTNTKPMQLIREPSKLKLKIFKYNKCHLGGAHYFEGTIGGLKEINVELNCEYQLPDYKDFLSYMKLNNVDDLIEDNFTFLYAFQHSRGWENEVYYRKKFSKLQEDELRGGGYVDYSTKREIYETLFALKHAIPKHNFKIGDEVIVIDNNTIKYICSIEKYMINMTDGTRYYSFEIKNSDRVEQFNNI